MLVGVVYSNHESVFQVNIASIILAEILVCVQMLYIAGVYIYRDHFVKQVVAPKPRNIFLLQIRELFTG